MDPWLDIAGRQLIVGYFLVAGIMNLTKARIAEHIARMRSYGMPFPRAAFWVGIALQFTGAALLALDWHPALGTVFLIVFTLAATAIFHRFWERADPVQRNFSRITLLASIGLLGALLLLLENVR